MEPRSVAVSRSLGGEVGGRSLAANDCGGNSDDKQPHSGDANECDTRRFGNRIRFEIVRRKKREAVRQVLYLGRLKGLPSVVYDPNKSSASHVDRWSIDRISERRRQRQRNCFVGGKPRRFVVETQSRDGGMRNQRVAVSIRSNCEPGHGYKGATVNGRHQANLIVIDAPGWIKFIYQGDGRKCKNPAVAPESLA